MKKTIKTFSLTYDVWYEAKKKETISDWCVFLILYIPCKILRLAGYTNKTYFDVHNDNYKVMVIDYSNTTVEVKKCRFLGFNLFYNDKLLGNEEGVKIVNLQGSTYAHALSDIANSKNDIIINKIRLNTDRLKNFDQTLLLKTKDGFGYEYTSPVNLALVASNLKKEGAVHDEIIEFKLPLVELSGNYHIEFNIAPKSKITVTAFMEVNYK